MYVAVVHRIKDPQARLSRGESLADASNAPPGVTPRRFLPSTDLSAATCLGGDSVDAVRDYIDSTLGDSSDNSYFEVSTQHVVHLFFGCYLLGRSHGIGSPVYCEGHPS
jgi:hypothetical protein